MPHNVAVHQSLHRLLRQTLSLEKKPVILFRNHNLLPLKLYNGPFQVYCINPEGRISVITIRHEVILTRVDMHLGQSEYVYL